MNNKGSGLLASLDEIQEKEHTFFYALGLDYKQWREILTTYEENYYLKHGEPHCQVTTEQLKGILEAMTYLTDVDGYVHDLVWWYGDEALTERYKRIIALYFAHQFNASRYTIFHFMSGNIRLYRFRDLERLEAKGEI